MSELVKIVSLADPALDVTAMGKLVSTYARKRDPALVKEIVGSKLAWFTIRRIPTGLFQRVVLEGVSEADRHRRAFVVGVSSIQNLYCTDERVRERFEPAGNAAAAHGQISIWTDEQMDLIAPAYVEEIGSVAETYSFLAPNSVVSYVLPQSSVRVLTARVNQDAAERLDAAPSSAGPDSAAPSNGENTAVPMPAHAMAGATSDQEASPTQQGSFPGG